MRHRHSYWNMIAQEGNGWEGGKQQPKSNKIGTRCEDWKKVKIWGRKNMLVSACALGGAGGGKNTANSTGGGSERRGVLPKVSWGG
jgi:hypothetical protein